MLSLYFRLEEDFLKIKLKASKTKTSEFLIKIYLIYGYLFCKQNLNSNCISILAINIHIINILKNDNKDCHSHAFQLKIHFHL